MNSKKLQDAVNEQIQKEFHSSALYLAMAAWCEAASLPGFASWMKAQSDEEREHGMRFFNHLADRGAKIAIRGIEQPQSEFKSPLDMFEKALAHEKHITASINKLYEIAFEERDYPAQVMLQWFINEQVEEEKNASLVVDQLRTLPEKGGSLLFMDRQLGKRGKKAA
jgi:ferritin